MARRRPHGEHHARRIASLIRREGRQLHAAVRLRRDIDRQLVAARRGGIPYKAIAFEIQQESGTPATAEELERIEIRVRKRASVAARRAGVMGAHTSVIAQDGDTSKDGDRKVDPMNQSPLPPYRRRTVEIDEWFEPAPPVCVPPLGAPDEPIEREPGLGNPRDYDDSDE